MASQRDQQHLKKVGLEGFALIDEYFGRTRRSNQSQRVQSPQPQVNQTHYQPLYYRVQHQQSYVCQVPEVYTVMKEPVTNYPGTSQHQYYGGRGISEEPQVYTVTKEPVTNYNGTSQHQYYGRRIFLRDHKFIQ
ncbi:hypothetical protein REPUB_Repub20aG0129900 [Reevesia pubescens]